MTVYRICRSKYPKNDGAGAALGGGRWNHKGTPMLYCGATASLCALEVLVHSEDIPEDRVVISAVIPDDVPVETVSGVGLPADWNADIHPHSTRNLGTEWAAQNRSVVLSVPSAVVPDERNYLINPRHSDFKKIKFSKPKPFVFDPRLKKQL